ncbi:MAG: phytoene desaturase [Phycisphaeraceae bacterium]|nr:phytoene desaturase [Phycisphaeraceae bacterium]
MIASKDQLKSGRTSVAVIGSGLAGLSAACELASRGAKVTLIEKNAHLGGKMNVLTEQGFSFDMGPTIITIPDVLRGILTRAGRRVEDYIDLRRLDPQWRCFYEDGTVVEALERVDDMTAQLDRLFAGSGAAEGYRRFIAYARRMYRLSEKVFFYKDLGSVGDMMRLTPMRDPGLLRDVLAMRMHSTMAATAHKMIKEPHLAQLVEHFLQYVGSSPFLAPAILSLIAAAQVDHGVWYPMGGTRMVARSLERLLREHDAEIITGAAVARINAAGGRVRSIALADGRVIEADAVVSNCDVQRTLRDLDGSPGALARQRKIAATYTPACSGVVLYLGLSRQYDHLAHHNFLFSRNSRSEFGDIYHKGVPAADPTLYLAVPSRTDPGQAPPGCEALYVLIHTPYLRPGQRWEGPGGLMEQYRPVVMDKLRRHGMSDIDRHIVVERHLHPGLIDQWYNAEGGAIYGLASHGRLAGGFKPRNRSKVYPNLYFAGGSANPGPGVPMVLMSGVTAANSVAEDFGLGAHGSAPQAQIEAKPGAMAPV